MWGKLQPNMGMTGKVYQYLADDHRRLEEALNRATRDSPEIEPTSYSEFRAGLLRHIGMEEKILFPLAQAAGSGEVLPAIHRLHLDHGALAALLVLTPTESIATAIRTILESHNSLEEGPNGVYAAIEQLAGFDTDDVHDRLVNTPPVAMASYTDNPTAVSSARNALLRAAYDLKFNA
jgi:hypothetical protein